jgi:hypothetical protein
MICLINSTLKFWNLYVIYIFFIIAKLHLEHDAFNGYDIKILRLYFLNQWIFVNLLLFIKGIYKIKKTSLQNPCLIIKGMKYL